MIPDGLCHTVMALVHERHPGQVPSGREFGGQGSPRTLVCMWNVASSVGDVAQTVHIMTYSH